MTADALAAVDATLANLDAALESATVTRKPVGGYRFQFTNGSGCRFELYRARSGHFAVRVAESDESAAWDYDDCEDAREMTASVRDCRTMNDAIAVLVN
jgi:hypothetical protein